MNKIGLQSVWCIILALAFSCSHRGSVLRSESTDNGITILEDGKDVLFYQVKPKSLDGNFQRASYIHPLYNLDGNVITEDFPADHPHHHGIYSAWHQILVNDRRVADGWTSDNIYLEVVDTGVAGNSQKIRLVSEVLWKLLSDAPDDKPIVKETLEIIVHESTDRFRMIDYNMTLVPLKDGVKIGGSDDEKGYGGFSLRLKLPDDIRFIARGKEVQPRVESVDAGPWMNFTGSFDGKKGMNSGVVVFSHPTNPGSPQPWILRREKSMQNPVWPGRLPIQLNKVGVRLKYRMIIHKGLEEHGIEELYRDYAR